MCCCFFFFNDTATTEIYTLSLHDALPICARTRARSKPLRWVPPCMLRIVLVKDSTVRSYPVPQRSATSTWARRDRKSTRLNSSHANISYAVFCLKKKKKHTTRIVQHLVEL